MVGTNWRSQPLRATFQSCWAKSQADVTGSFEKRRYFSRYDHWSQAVSGVMATAAKAVGREHGGIIRKPSDARQIWDSGSKGERSRSQTASCDCEPVWGKRSPAVKDEFTSRHTEPVSQPDWEMRASAPRSER